MHLHLHLLLLLLGGQVLLFVQKKPEKQETEGRHNMSETPSDRNVPSFTSHSWRGDGWCERAESGRRVVFVRPGSTWSSGTALLARRSLFHSHNDTFHPPAVGISQERQTPPASQQLTEGLRADLVPRRSSDPSNHNPQTITQEETRPGVAAGVLQVSVLPHMNIQSLSAAANQRRCFYMWAL